MGKLTQRLTDAARSGVYRVPRTDEVLDAVRGTGLDVAQADLGSVRDKSELLQALARALGFPDWFGGNWDALEDCLSDLSWRPGTGQVLLLRGHDALLPDDLGVLLDVLAASAAFWAERRRPFFVAILDPARALALPDLFRPKSA